MRIAAHPCYILHQRPYRETSLLLEVFSAEQGRVGLIARGAKRKQSHLQPVLQPFQRLQLAWTGRGELGIVVNAEVDVRSPALQSEALMAGFYINELVMRLLHRHESNPALFCAYEQILQELAGGKHMESCLRIFELNLLQSIGYGLVLDHDVETRAPVVAEHRYRFFPERGPRLAGDTEQGGVVLQGRTLLELAAGHLGDATVLREAKQLLRQEISRQLGGRPLASRQLYRAYMQQRQPKTTAEDDS